MRKFHATVFSVIEYLLGLEYIYGGINTFFAHPIDTPSIFYDMLAGQAAIYFYAIFFVVTGAALIYAKISKKKRLHGWALIVMCLICFYVLTLAWVLIGPSTGMINAFVTGIATGALWLRWKLKTEYIRPKDFINDRRDLGYAPEVRHED